MTSLEISDRRGMGADEVLDNNEEVKEQWQIKQGGEHEARGTDWSGSYVYILRMTHL